MAEGRLLRDGHKDDQQKNRVELLPFDALLELGKLFTFGASKYEDRNWEKGIKFSRIYGAMMRHAWLWWLRKDIDEESGMNHMVHAAWNALILVTYILRHMDEFDDRPQSV